MKIPNLPAECIRKMLTNEEMTNLRKELSKSARRATILAMINLYGINSYTINKLDKLGVLNNIISASIYLCNRYELTKEALELFDEVKSNTKALQYFISQIKLLGRNLLKAPGVTQHILDTLIGPEWKEPDFYLYKDFGLWPFFDRDLMRKKDIGNILCNGLCIFDDIPEDRLNKFYDALRRLKPYIKRRGFRYTIRNSVYTSYKLKDFPISIPERIKRYTSMNLEWHIENNQLIIKKEFKIYDYCYHIPRKELKDFLKRLKGKYPEQMQEAYYRDTDMQPLYWEHSRKYNLPDDLRGLNNM